MMLGGNLLRLYCFTLLPLLQPPLLTTTLCPILLFQALGEASVDKTNNLATPWSFKDSESNKERSSRKSPLVQWTKGGEIIRDDCLEKVTFKL